VIIRPEVERQLDPNAPLDRYERYLLEKLFSEPAELPLKFKNWVADYVARNGDFIVSDIPSLKGEEWREVLGGIGFENSWVNFGGSDATAAFYKDATGIVRLKGFIKNGTLDVAAFTLPAGYCVSTSQHFPTTSYNGSAFIYGSIEILANGQVRPRTPGHNAGFSLAPISFRAA